MGIKPSYSSDFELPAEGTYLLRVDKVEFKKEDKGLTCLIRDVVEDSIEHGDNFNEQGILDNFPLYTDFAKARLLGLGVKALGMDADKEYADNYFDDEKIQKKLMTSLIGKTFGGKVKHDKTGKFANIKEYYTPEEYDEKSHVDVKDEKKAEKKGDKKEGKKAEDAEW